MDRVVELLERISKQLETANTGTMNLRDAAEFCGVSHPILIDWIKAGKSPMGPITEGQHYYRVGNFDPSRKVDNREYRFIKRQLAILFKMMEG